MKIQNTDESIKYNNISNPFQSSGLNGTNLQNSFFEALNKSSEKFDKNNNKNNVVNTNTIAVDKKITVLDVNNMSDKGKDLISTVDKFLKSNPSKKTFNDTVNRAKEVVSKKKSPEEVKENATEEVSDDKVAEELIALFLNNTVEVDTTNITEDTSLNTDVIGDVLLDNINESTGMDEDLEFNNISDLLDSTENEFTKLLESFNADETMIEDANETLKDILELSNSLTDDMANNANVLVKKEDIRQNTDNLFINSTSGVDLDVKVEKASTKSPVLNQVLQSVYSQLSGEPINEKTTELRLKLFPSRLGSISVIIEKDNGNLNIHLISESQEVRNLLMDSMQDLKTELSKTNINSINVNVSSDNSSSNSGDSKNQNTLYTDALGNDYIDDISTKISINNTIIDKILDIKI